ncbi:19450_t:CDS:1 [Entrophospora sp. SA101]|nr:19450_t:CDS:1 [Entrophospora sp. SA101]
MIENLIPPDVITFTTLIHGYKIKKDPSMIKYTLKEMDGFGIDIDKFLFTTLIYSYLQNNDLTNAFKIYQKIVEQNIQLDRRLLVSFIYLKAALSDSEGSRKIFDIIKAKGIIPNTKSFNALLYAYSRDPKVTATQLEKVFMEMLSENVEPNQFTFEILIDGCCKKNDLLSAKNVLIEMKKRNIHISKFASNSFIRQYSLNGQSELAWKFFDKMVFSGIKPDLFIYTSIISLATSTSNFKKAYVIIENLIKSGLKLDLHTYTAVMSLLIKSKRVDQAISIFIEMMRQNILPDVVILTVLIQGLGIAKRFDHIKKVYDFMKKFNIKPDRFVYYYLEPLYKKFGSQEELESLNQDMIKYNIDPGSKNILYTKGKGPRYWKMKFLINRRIDRRKSLYNDSITEKHLKSLRKQRKNNLHKIV